MNTTAPDEYCQRKAAKSGSSFYYSFRLLPPPARERTSVGPAVDLYKDFPNFSGNPLNSSGEAVTYDNGVRDELLHD